MPTVLYTLEHMYIVPKEENLHFQAVQPIALDYIKKLF